MESSVVAAVGEAAEAAATTGTVEAAPALVTGASHEAPTAEAAV